MQLTHEFTVPAGIEETWSALEDIESVAGCFPGAQVTHADERSFEGTVKVKLGPIALVYKGSGEFVDKDAAAHRMTIRATGKDKRGNGTAGADVVATMTEQEAGRTHVEVVTDLNVTGKPAQFGRGVMQDVSDKLLGQFVDCLADRLGSGRPADAVPAGTSSEPEAAPAPDAAPAPAVPASVPRATDDAVDLGAVALPVLLRTYGPTLAAALGGLVLGLLLGRGRRRSS
ncbi:SRPBCC family protein [Janibacter terrae]|uniref:SRPBCC family protein n=1 Tax=Janibacter terrae TaxID=103817 RepID=A0ABZ2FFU3_9MICO